MKEKLAQDYNVTLEDALRIIGVGNKPFKKKLSHSIDLLRKAEKLALRYDNEDGFYLAFSGGKDSQALYYVAKMAGVRFKAHINFTSVDPPQLVKFVKRQYPDVVMHAPKKSIYQLAVERNILPSMRIRWCCADLKESAGAGKVTLIGIRKSESARRAKRHEVEVSGKQFSGTLDEFGEWQQQQIEKKEAKLLRKMKREGKKVNEDFFSANKENEVRCINGKDSILISPIFEWSEADVWYFLNEVVKVPHCELYDQGYKRIGCILCPMSQYRQKVREMKDFPHVKRNWIKAIKEIRNGGGGLVSHQRKIADGYIWCNIPEHGTSRNVSGMPGTGCAKLHHLQQRFGNRYTPTEWNNMFQRLAEEVRRRQEFTPPHHWNRKGNTGIWAGFSTPTQATGRVFG